MQQPVMENRRVDEFVEVRDLFIVSYCVPGPIALDEGLWSVDESTWTKEGNTQSFE